ncbi:MAG TPA: HAMP domain-containing sensor histidine kinase [Puia sp.]|uniref:sensor histidine kinase n=1 Tax=Puia sp. TaxID=2045100 RepID=UPI002BE59320|nr:HAMP domain-containing sensor histidine kinase [Puia sp.]HVU94361.1 HAMP domain-containing sensor histidine kinase [Puia sp.]
MKLTTQYYRHIVPAVTVLFLAVIVSSFFLIRLTLQTELDSILLRSKLRVEAYVRANGRLPEVSTFNDQQIHFRRVAALRDSVLSDTMQYIPEQLKNHISRKLCFTLLLHDQPWEVTISEPLEGTRHLTILIAKIAIVTILVTLFLFVLINRSVLRRLWRPFYRSLELIQEFKVDEPGRPVYPESPIEEFRLMNQHFSQAAENANRDYRNLKEFSENASHELQTPLAIIRGNLDLLVQEPMTDRQSELLEGIYGSVRRMTRLQESLLLLTKIDNRQFTSIHTIRLDLLLQDKLQQLQELLHARSLRSHFELAETSLAANRELMDILLNNLFSNAIRHNVADGEIRAQLGERCLRVSNTGMGEALDESRIFRRFYKNGAKAENNGLGLSIIKQICDTTAMRVGYEFAEGWHSFVISW